MRVADNAQLVDERVATLERRLQFGQKLAEHALRLDTRLRLHNAPPDVQVWLETDLARAMMWYEICCKADVDGHFKTHDITLGQSVDKGKRSYFYRWLVQANVLESTSKGAYRVVMGSHDNR